MNLLQMVYYPFLSESLEYLRKNGPTLDDLLHNIAYERTRIQGKERVLEALEGAQIEDHRLVTEADYLVELLSYITCRILISSVNDPYLIKRYALAEAKTAGSRLQNEEFEFVVRVANELNMDVILNNGMCTIHFIHYLKNTSQMRSKPWKIANQDLENGYITLSKNRLARVIQYALQMKIEGELPQKVNEEILEVLKKDIREIKNKVEVKKNTFKAEDFGKVRVTKLPPCMRNMLAKVQAGENLPHSGRFALTSFLHSIGMSAEEILKLFGTSPDFDADKSRYQIEHITGKISGTEYTPPECSTMKSYGICFDEDHLCKKEWMTHPLKYYRTKDKSKKKDKKKQKDERSSKKQ